MSTKNTKGVKMSLGDFMGGAPATGVNALPTAPKQRGPEDDGSFQRQSRYEDGPDREISRADQDSSWRRGGSRDFGDRDGRFNDDRGGGLRDDRGGLNRRGGYRDDRGGSRDDRGGFDRSVGSRESGPARGSSAPMGERPRLQLKSRTAPIPDVAKKDEGPIISQFGRASSLETKGNYAANKAEQQDHFIEKEAGLVKETPILAEEVKVHKADKIDKQQFEPSVVNSRAAMLNGGPEKRRDNDGHRDRGDRGFGHPPAVNKRFADLAQDDRERIRENETRRADRSNDRGPPPVANSRFAAAAEAGRSAYTERDDRGPPPVANSRFAAAAEADRTLHRDRQERGPPPVTNSRFAAAAEADRSSHRSRDERGPPPVTNSRFAAAADADRSLLRDRDERGPPPVANSRFAAAAAMAEEEKRDRGRHGFDSDNGFADDRMDGRLLQNSRFAAVAVEKGHDDSIRHGSDRGSFEDRGRADRFDRRGRGEFDRQGSDAVDRNDDRGFGTRPSEHQGPQKKSVAELLKPKVRPLEENILKIPTKREDENMLKPPVKKPTDDLTIAPKKAAANLGLTAALSAAPTTDASPAVDDTAMIKEFISGNKLGGNLREWVGQQIIPSIEKLVFTFLDETQKLNPDVSCAWAEPDRYGSALVSLVEDDLLKQADVLFAIQKYCNKIGMPKLDDEYVIQAMFRSMYKYDLASDEAFDMWKEDESEEHEAGKVTAVIQTVEWFNWLEEDEEGDDEE